MKMCWWVKKEEPMKPVTRRLLTFGKNKYGGGNDLNGCINDSKNFAKKVKELFPDFDTRIYTDNQVTVSNYIAKVTEAKNLLRPGATIIVPMDSCFSGTATRLYPLNPGRIKNRFFDPGLPPRSKIRKRIFRGYDDITWIALSGCGEHQTCADAYIEGQSVGAFTCYLLKSLDKGITYREWFNITRGFLPNLEFDQAPEIEGPDYLLNRKIFEDETLIIHNSSHGSYTYDTNGDEADGQDEGLYFDYLLIDDVINSLLRQN
jgi:hypothetical protein